MVTEVGSLLSYFPHTNSGFLPVDKFFTRKQKESWAEGVEDTGKQNIQNKKQGNGETGKHRQR